MLTSFLLESRSMKTTACGNAMLDTSNDSTLLEAVVCSAAAFVRLDSIEETAIALQMVSVFRAPMAL